MSTNSAAESDAFRWALNAPTYRLVQYTDQGEKITDAAYADLNIGEHAARVLIVYKETEGGRVVLVPQGKTNTNKPT